MRWSYLLSAGQVHKTLQVLQRTTLGPAPHKAGPVLPEATEHKKKDHGTAYTVENPGPGLGSAQKCGGVQPVNLKTDMMKMYNSFFL